MLAVGEDRTRTVDRDLLALALAEDRILLTEDKDFGWLVFAVRLDSPEVGPHAGIDLHRGEVYFLSVPQHHGPTLGGAFVVWRPGGFRVSR